MEIPAGRFNLLSVGQAAAGLLAVARRGKPAQIYNIGTGVDVEAEDIGICVNEVGNLVLDVFQLLLGLEGMIAMISRVFFKQETE